MLERSSLSCRKTNMTMRCSLLVFQRAPYSANTDDRIEDAVQANFFIDVGKFFCAVVREMVKIFRFNDRVINALVALDLIKRAQLTYVPIVRLAERTTSLWGHWDRHGRRWRTEICWPLLGWNHEDKDGNGRDSEEMVALTKRDTHTSITFNTSKMSVAINANTWLLHNMLVNIEPINNSSCQWSLPCFLRTYGFVDTFTILPTLSYCFISRSLKGMVMILELINTLWVLLIRRY